MIVLLTYSDEPVSLPSVPESGLFPTTGMRARDNGDTKA